MEEFVHFDQRNSSINSFTTFTVPYTEEIIEENICITTNISNKPSEEGIINHAYNFHAKGDFLEAEKYYKYFSDLKLLDYKVRILNTGTGATTRVSIESTDKTGKSWFTIGVSQNIIEASFKALIDSLEYKLFKEKAPANN